MFTIFSLQMFYFKIVEMLKVRSFSKIIKQYNVSNVYIFVASDASERTQSAGLIFIDIFENQNFTYNEI